MAQKLFLMADRVLDQRIRQPNNRLKELLAKHTDDSAALEELFLATLSRKPDADEIKAFTAIRKREPNRQAAFQAALYALLNTNEFIFNH